MFAPDLIPCTALLILMTKMAFLYFFFLSYLEWPIFVFSEQLKLLWQPPSGFDLISLLRFALRGSQPHSPGFAEATEYFVHCSANAGKCYCIWEM